MNSKRDYPTTYYRAREGAGLTREEVAVALGKSASTVGRYELGTSLPDAHDVFVMARLFGVSADELLGLALPTGRHDGA